MRIPFVGPTYTGRSQNIDPSRCINFFPEMSAPGSKDVASLIGTPGYTMFANLSGAAPVRGLHVFNGVLYVIAGNKLLVVTGAGAVNQIGTISTSNGPVVMLDNGISVAGVGGNQMIIVDGKAGYIFDITTNLLTAITGGAWPVSVSSVTYIDGYFIASVLGSMTLYCSELYDGTTWNVYSSAVSSPDTVQAVYNLNEQLWVVKQYSSEVWFNTGTPTSSGFPFQRMAGAVVDFGTIAGPSISRIGSTLYFLGNRRNSDGGEFVGVMKMANYSPEIISPPAITYRISQMSIISDAISFSYYLEGHSFYVLTFPTANATLVYDETTKMWHEWSSYQGDSTIGRHISNCYAYFNVQHIIGDYVNGFLYALSSSVYSDNGTNIVSVRIAQSINDKNDLNSFFINKMQIDAETGIGNVNNPAKDPQAMLSWSNDGGHVWSNDYAASLGKIGQYKTRLIWRRVGNSRDRVFKLVISDPIKKVLIGQVIEGTKGSS